MQQTSTGFFRDLAAFLASNPATAPYLRMTLEVCQSLQNEARKYFALVEWTEVDSGGQRVSGPDLASGVSHRPEQTEPQLPAQTHPKMCPKPDSRS